MLCFKNHCFLIRIIAGFGNPLDFAVFIHISRIQVASLLILLRCIRNSNTDALSVQTDLFGFFAVFHFPQGNIVDRSCADSRLCFNRGNRGFLHLQNDVAVGLAVQFFKGIPGETKIGHRIGVDGKVLNLDLHIFPCVTHIYRNHHSNTVCGVAILFRISNCFVNCLLDGASGNVGISVDPRFHRCGLTGGRGARIVLVRSVNNRRILPIIRR